MDGSIDRRTFLRVQVLASLGFYLSSCRRESSPATTVAPAASPIPAAPVDPPPPTTVATDDLLLFRQDAERYEELRGGFNLRVQKHPAVIVLCRDVNDISTAVRYARQEGLAISVKSGGHSFEGFSSNEDGLVIDLSLLNQVEWLDSETVRVGPGCKLSELYDALLPRGRILPAGSCGGVGVGGLALGGGYGLFSRQFGLTCDSLTELTLVDGKGDVHLASTDDELLWACRGAGNGNFGVVAGMMFRTDPAPTGLFRYRFKANGLDPARAASLMETWFRVAADLPLSAFSAFVLNRRTLRILITDTGDQGPKLKAALDTLAAVTDNAIYGTRQSIAPAIRRFYGIADPTYFKNVSAGFYNDFTEIQAAAEEVAALVGESRGLIFQVNTLGGKVANPAFERASAFPHRGSPFLAELQAYFDKPTQEPARMKAVRQVQTVLRENGVHRHYRNYPDLELPDWESAYYGENYLRLQQIKRRYDPDNLFRYPQSIQPT